MVRVTRRCLSSAIAWSGMLRCSHLCEHVQTAISNFLLLIRLRLISSILFFAQWTFARSRLDKGTAFKLGKISSYAGSLPSFPCMAALIAVTFGPAGLAGWLTDAIGRDCLKVQCPHFYQKGNSKLKQKCNNVLRTWNYCITAYPFI